MNFDDLKRLTALKFQSSQQALTEVLGQERTLRAELDRLSTLARETQSQPPEHAQMRAMGGDVIWLKWIGDSQRHLNIRLAQTLAQKEMVMAQHAKVHGRKLVAEHLADQTQDTGRKRRKEAFLRSAINHAVRF